MGRRVQTGLLVVAAWALALARITQAAEERGGRVEAADVHLTSSPVLAVVHYCDGSENVIDGKPRSVRFRATATVRTEGGPWTVIEDLCDTRVYLQGR